MQHMLDLSKLMGEHVEEYRHSDYQCAVAGIAVS